MDIDLAALPDDVETLRRMVRSLAAERTALSEAQAEIERLRAIVQKLQRSQFGQRAERLDEGQLQFGFEDLEADLARAEGGLLREGIDVKFVFIAKHRGIWPADWRIGCAGRSVSRAVASMRG
jgi:hypothetical protein